MSYEISQKIKKVFIYFILGILAIVSLLAVASLLSYFSHTRETRMSSGTAPLMGKAFSRESFAGFMMDQGDNSSASIESATPTSGTGEFQTPIVERKLTQDGNLSLVVTRVEDGVASLTRVAEKLGGRVDSVSYQNIEGDDKKNAIVVFRVPAGNFSQAMIEAKALGRKVVAESIATRDVTEQFVDMQARLKTLKATEEQYLLVMNKAEKIDDILNASKYLSDVRTQIEQIQGQMNYLSRQVDMSVITVDLTSEPEINPAGVIWNPGTVAKNSLRDFVQAFYSFINTMIRLVLFYLPVLVLLGIFAFLAFIFFVKVLRPWYGASKNLFHF